MLFFAIMLSSSSPFVRHFIGKMKSGCPERREKGARNFSGPGRAGHPFAFRSSHRKEPKSCSLFMFTDVLKDQQQNSLISQKERDQVQEAAIQVATADNKNCRQWSSKGSCSRGATHAFSGTMARIMARRKERSAVAPSPT